MLELEPAIRSGCLQSRVEAHTWLWPQRNTGVTLLLGKVTLSLYGEMAEQRVESKNMFIRV